MWLLLLFALCFVVVCENSSNLSRHVKRDYSNGVQCFSSTIPGPPGFIGAPITISQQIYSGYDDPADGCPRDSVEYDPSLNVQYSENVRMSYQKRDLMSHGFQQQLHNPPQQLNNPQQQFHNQSPHFRSFQQESYNFPQQSHFTQQQQHQSYGGGSNDNCHRLTTRGPCSVSEMIIQDPYTRKGFCAPRLCHPDRVFVFSTQLCHDPRDPDVCPYGRELYVQADGTPICSCPDGYYEKSNSVCENVCEPLLAMTGSCPYGQVLWFQDYQSLPSCQPDPCDMQNLQRSPDPNPYLPLSSNGQCVHVGEMCGPRSCYATSLNSLSAECVTFEEAGFDVFTEQDLQTLLSFYGDPIFERTGPFATPRDTATFQSGPLAPTLNNNVNRLSSYASTVSEVNIRSPSGSVRVQGPFSGPMQDLIQQAGLHQQSAQLTFLPNSNQNGRRKRSVLKTLAEVFGVELPLDVLSESEEDIMGSLEDHTLLSRVRRHTGTNVAQGRLNSCQAGSARNENTKCRQNIISERRQGGARAPVAPNAPCPSGQVYNTRRRCVSADAFG